MFAGSPGTEASARAALARARESAAPIPEECEGFSLVVDLAAEPVGRRWIRGVGTLALLCGAALALGPGIDPFSSAVARSIATWVLPVLVGPRIARTGASSRRAMALLWAAPGQSAR